MFDRQRTGRGFAPDYPAGNVQLHRECVSIPGRPRYEEFDLCSHGKGFRSVKQNSRRGEIRQVSQTRLNLVFQVQAIFEDNGAGISVGRSSFGQC
jgi:hypothetical protein